jgi:CBS domain-containing protein
VKVTKTQEMVYELKVTDVMTKDVITVNADDPMALLRNILRRNRFSGLPVLNDQRLAGLISVEDFIHWLASGQQGGMIEDHMTHEVATIYDDAPLIAAIRKFEETALGRFPVVDRCHGSVVGILTKGDVIKGLLKKLEVDLLEEEAYRSPARYLFKDFEADQVTLQFRYSVKGQDFKQAGESSSRLKKTLKRLGIPPALARRVAIASYEAELNLVVFTKGGRIRADVQPTTIRITVNDSGPGIADIDKALMPGYSTAPDWVRELGFGAGMGLVNIKNIADKFNIRSELGKGTHLNILFFTNGDKREAG